jgi:hypothetical protein
MARVMAGALLEAMPHGAQAGFVEMSCGQLNPQR